MIRNPFRFGEPVEGDSFTGRYRERELLLAELPAGRNVRLSGPRHFGKSSLARKIRSELERQGIMTLYIDIERAYSFKRLIELYLAELLRTAFRQASDLQVFIETLHPDLKKMLLIRDESGGELTVDLSQTSEPAIVAQALWDLSELTAKHKSRPCVVCCDEINPEGALASEFWKQMPGIARRHTHVGYLLVTPDTGSEAEQDGFISLQLGRIEERYLKAFVKTRFENTGYRIHEGVIDEILAFTAGHPHYTQMICRELWSLSHGSKVISEKNVTHSLESLLETHALYYSTLWRELSPHQKNLLLAIGIGGGRKIFSQDYITQHNLGSFSTVQKSLSRLLAMQTLERRDESYVFQDGFFQQWVIRRMQ